MSWNPRTSHPRLAKFFACLALAGAAAAAAAAVLSILPATVSRVDHAVPASNRRPVLQAPVVGLDHAGGDLRRSIRLTLRSTSRGFGQPWTDSPIVRRQATSHVLTA
jgi:hypothetical protein